MKLDDLDKDVLDEFTAFMLDSPKIPNNQNLWGREYKSKCSCGGTITARRNTYNGHYFAKCDKCGMTIME